MERCLKSGLLLEKGHKEEVTVKKEEVWTGDLGSTQGLMCWGWVEWTHILARYLGWKQEYRLCNSENQNLKDPCDKATMSYGISFQYWHHLIVLETMTSDEDKLKVVKQKMTKVNTDVLQISELK